MSDQSTESIEEPEAMQDKPIEHISPKGIDAMRGEYEAEQDDLEKYLDQLYKHVSRMREIGNMPEAEQTEEEIKRVNKQLYETVQKKHGIKPDGAQEPGK